MHSGWRLRRGYPQVVGVLFCGWWCRVRVCCGKGVRLEGVGCVLGFACWFVWGWCGVWGVVGVGGGGGWWFVVGGVGWGGGGGGWGGGGGRYLVLWLFVRGCLRGCWRRLRGRR